MTEAAGHHDERTTTMNAQPNLDAFGLEPIPSLNPSMIASIMGDPAAAGLPGFQEAEAALAFILAGNARFTITSKKTGQRFTYKVRRPADDKPWFVSLLTGSDNENDYTFFGTIFADRTFRHGRRTSISDKAPSAVGFSWLWAHLSKGSLPGTIDIHHEGRCGRCGRTLTVPASIESGFGPECINHL
jgi:hypothetical protein